MISIILRTLKNRKWSILIYILAGIVFIWMYVALFPTFADTQEQFNEVLKTYPESFLDSFGIKDTASIFSNIENFLATENYSLIWPIMAIALGISLGGSSIAGEVESKTIETLLSQPISRTKLFLSKYLSGSILITVFTIITTLSVIPISSLYGVEYQAKSHIAIMALGLLFGISIFSISSMLSSIFDEKSKANFISIGILVLMYASNLVASLKDSLSDLKYSSLFYYFDSSKALVEKTITSESLLVFLSIIIVATLIGLLVFNKKDISVS